MEEHGECLEGTLMKCPGMSQGEPQGMPRWTYIIIIIIINPLFKVDFTIIFL